MALPMFDVPCLNIPRPADRDVITPYDLHVARYLIGKNPQVSVEDVMRDTSLSRLAATRCLAAAQLDAASGAPADYRDGDAPNMRLRVIVKASIRPFGDIS